MPMPLYLSLIFFISGCSNCILRDDLRLVSFSGNSARLMMMVSRTIDQP